MDPRDLGIPYPEIEMPEQFWIDDTMILPPAKDPLSVTIYRGPNIGDPPAAEPLPGDHQRCRRHQGRRQDHH